MYLAIYLRPTYLPTYLHSRSITRDDYTSSCLHQRDQVGRFTTWTRTSVHYCATGSRADDVADREGGEVL